MSAPYIANSFTRADALVDEIVDRVSTFITEGERGMANIVKSRDGLDSLDDPFPAGYLETVQYINTQAAANPGDAAWQALKARMGKVVADYQVAKTRFTNIAAAIDGM